MTLLYDRIRKKEQAASAPAERESLKAEREACLAYFAGWNEADQVQFIYQIICSLLIE